MPCLNTLYKKRDEETGEWIFGVTPLALELIKKGYACNRCLEVFEVGGVRTWLPECPLCGEPTSVGEDRKAIVETPEGW